LVPTGVHHGQNGIVKQQKEIYESSGDCELTPTMTSLNRGQSRLNLLGVSLQHVHPAHLMAVKIFVIMFL
jgi:hypothetical protein